MLQGLSSGELLTPNAAYRATWSRRSGVIAAAETVTLGAVKTDQASLAADLDEQLSTTCFYRGSPLSFGADVITWDLVARSNAAQVTAAQGARGLDQASAYLKLETLTPRARTPDNAQRESARAAAEAATQAAVSARPSVVDKLLTGLKAFGLTTAVLGLAAVAVYAYATRKARPG